MSQTLVSEFAGQPAKLETQQNDPQRPAQQQVDAGAQPIRHALYLQKSLKAIRAHLASRGRALHNEPKGYKFNDRPTGKRRRFSDGP